MKERKVAFAFLLLFLCFEWGRLLQWGQVPFVALDWVKEQAYWQTLRVALDSRTLPFQTSYSMQDTFLFLANPEVAWTPAILILPWITNIQYFMVNFFVTLAIGCVGFYRWMKRIDASVLATVVGGLVFFLNGHIVAQIFTGHSMWMAYFLLPWFFLFLDAEQSEPGRGRRGIALTLAGMLFLGGLHLVVQAILFLGIAALLNRLKRESWVPLGLAVLSVCLFRFLPAFYAMRDRSAMRFSGFYNLDEVIVRVVSLSFEGAYGLGWWDWSYYISAPLLILLVVAWRNAPKVSIQMLWGLPALVMGFFSIARMAGPFRWVPFFSSQRVPSRLLVYPLVALVLMSLPRLYAKNRSETVWMWGLAVWGAVALHLQVTVIAKMLADGPPPDRLFVVDLAAIAIVPVSDPWIVTVIAFSWLVSFTALGILSTNLDRTSYVFWKRL